MRELNREGAQADLADALQGVVALQPNELALGAQHRAAPLNGCWAKSPKASTTDCSRNEARTSAVQPLMDGTAGGETDPQLTPGQLGGEQGLREERSVLVAACDLPEAGAGCKGAAQLQTTTLFQSARSLTVAALMRMLEKCLMTWTSAFDAGFT